jgi:hypothetical protein
MKLLMRLKNGLLEVFFYKESVNLVDWNRYNPRTIYGGSFEATYGSNGTVFSSGVITNGIV